jgi:hypothetical protein
MAEAKAAMKELDTAEPEGAMPEEDAPLSAEPEPEVKIDPTGAFEIVNGKWQPVAGSTYNWRDLYYRLMAERAALKPKVVPPLDENGWPPGRELRDGWYGWHSPATSPRAEPTTPKEDRTIQLGDCLVCSSKSIKKKGKRGIVVSIGAKGDATCKIVDEKSGAIMTHFGSFKHSHTKDAVEFDDECRSVYREFSGIDAAEELAKVVQAAVVQKLDVQLAEAAPEPNREFIAFVLFLFLYFANT